MPMGASDLEINQDMKKQISGDLKCKRRLKSQTGISSFIQPDEIHWPFVPHGSCRAGS